MRATTRLALTLALFGSAPALAEDAKPKPAPKATPKVELVDAATVIPDLILDLRYATKDNFLKRQVYPDGARCLLLPDSVSRLKKAADVLRPQGYRLKVYDCYRPRAVQYEMWKILPKPGYVANPAKGSNHNRGGAVDLTLATVDGGEVEMPTPFDDFTPKAHHGYMGGTPASREHREVLRAAMEGVGFQRNKMEWWHYDLPGATKLPVLDVPFTPTN
ncbi:D-alanyl-D-alanine dipeptidase [Corallococcus terminator]|uniref:D-alanyl-D-alanine dipeptidase n=1 Tax=Corallococcus terminator TaxID=2316733 RepID=A0A3A8J123_9BACT|nr:D-alanyl-D-alanine dipeptidase [Corallococcus terminator]RKG85874.1 D-alanyl-D-alanine dipeptidase [Corallococcus terminator]